MNINVGLQLSKVCGLFEAMTAAVPRRMPPTRADGDDRPQSAAGKPPPVIAVLVIDDDPQILGALRINLSVHGYAVTVATTGAAALQAATDKRPDIVSLDLGLPDMSGIDVLKRLRERSSVPVIVLSARTDSSDKIQALDAGADDYVTKPFGMGELLARLRATVRRSAAALDIEEPVVQTSSFTIDLAAEKVTKTARRCI